MQIYGSEDGGLVHVLLKHSWNGPSYLLPGAETQPKA